MDTTVFFPQTVVDLNGHIVNVDELAKRYILILITLKATWCPVCPQLLSILNAYGLQDGDPPASFCDPSDRTITVVPQEEIPFYRLLLRQDAFFIILCPGPPEKIRKIQNDFKFSHFPYHFIADEDLSLSTSINLRMSCRNEIWPCIAHISSNALEIRIIFYGRGPGYYGYKDLLAYLREYRVQVEDYAAKVVPLAVEVDIRFKRSLTENSTENLQRQTEQPQQVFPVELLSQIFEYLEPTEIIKTVMATSRLWRVIGLEIIATSLRRETKSVSESLVTYPRISMNQMPYFSRIMMLTENKKLVSIYYLSQRTKNLYKLLNILNVTIRYNRPPTQP